MKPTELWKRRQHEKIEKTWKTLRFKVTWKKSDLIQKSKMQQPPQRVSELFSK